MVGMYGPDVTFLGVPKCDLSDAAALAAADAVVIGAPYDAGASFRAGARFGPQAIRTADYLPHDASRPHLALRVDALRDLTVLDAGDVEMVGVEGRQPLDRLEAAVQAVSEADAVPIVLGGDHADVTAFLANRVVLAMLSGIAYRRGGGRWSDIPPTLLGGRPR